MLYSISGKILHKEPFLCIVELSFTQGFSLSFEINVPLSLYEKLSIGESITLFTYIYIKEDNISLYGFLSKQERELFKKIISVSGIGPKVALQILSDYGVEEFRRIIEEEDIFSLSNIKGVGKKRAGLLLLELKQKMPGIGAKISPMEEEALNALLNLGLTRKDAESLLKKVNSRKFEKIEDLIYSLLKEARTGIS